MLNQSESLAAKRNDAIRVSVQANNAFALALYRRLTQASVAKNVFYSPYSISSALTTTVEGARDETAVEMGTVLRFPDTLRQSDQSLALPWDMGPLRMGLAALNEGLRGSDEKGEVRREIEELRPNLREINRQVEEPRHGQDWRELDKLAVESHKLSQRLNTLLASVDQYEIRVANALWREKSYPFRSEYLETLQKHYDSSAYAVDFKANCEAARTRINEWVEEQTNQRIKDLVPRGAVSELTSMVLANAIYFKGEWSEPFRESSTELRPFLLADGATAETDMMHASEIESGRYAAFEADGSFFETPHMVPADARSDDDPARYPSERGFALVELPYKGRRLGMVLIAPNRRNGLPDLETSLTPSDLDNWLGRLEARTVRVLLPKFKLETSYMMRETLQAMGMVRAFTDARERDGAQFGRMTKSTDPNEQLHISEVMHKAFVEVNEKGTEAAAATAVVAVAAAAPCPSPSVPFIPTFRADRPFLFLIRDRSTGAILFVGRMVRPSDS